MIVAFQGNTDLLKQQKTAFLCIRKIVRINRVKNKD